MSDIVKTIQSLPNLLPLKPASGKDITDAEIQLRISFADEYKEYLRSFGAIIADGIELTGITKADYRNVVAITKQEWELNSSVTHSMYVIENTGIDGIIIWQDANGTIYQSSPNAQPREIAKSLCEYILNRNH
jgi:hypothetical protein